MVMMRPSQSKGRTYCFRTLGHLRQTHFWYCFRTSFPASESSVKIYLKQKNQHLPLPSTTLKKTRAMDQQRVLIWLV